MKKRRAGCSLRTLPLPPLALALASVSPVWAQQSADSAASTPIATVDSIIVTGTRGVRTVADSLAPVDVIGEKELASTGQTDLRRALEEILPSFATAQGSSGGTGKAVKSGSLRGLGGNYVLVLVNGKRRHLSALTGGGAATGQSPADLNLIPTSAVARVEVLRDGAAAQYGSDAIAGVINVILKSASEGGNAAVGYGQYGKGPGGVGEQGKTKNVQLNQGLKLGEDGGFVNLSFEGSDQGNTNFSGPYKDSYLLYPKVNGAYDSREFGTSRYRQIWGQPSVENYVASYNAELPIGGGTKLYSFGTAARRISAVNGGYRAPTNPLVITEIFPDGYLSKLQVKEVDYQVVAGAKGNNIAGWDWDVSTSYARDNAQLNVLDALNASLGPTAPTRYYNGRQIFSEWTTNLDLTRSVPHDWAQEPLFVSLGAEFRRSTYAQRAGEWASYGDGGWVHPDGSNAGEKLNPGVAFQAGFTPDEAGSWSRHDTALYLDLSQKVNEDWDVGAAARLENYSDVGLVRSGKVSARYQVAPRWALRSTYSNGFRAPSLQQSYNQNSQAQWATNAYTGEQYHDLAPDLRTPI
ncbi:MAG: Vitamin B12 transporter BtuB [Burkholderia gladioli]|nr:MAG: Vitamin B12 transporter BtuB [Burkholderia gladioli]